MLYERSRVYHEYFLNELHDKQNLVFILFCGNIFLASVNKAVVQEVGRFFFFFFGGVGRGRGEENSISREKACLSYQNLE